MTYKLVFVSVVEAVQHVTDDNGNVISTVKTTREYTQDTNSINKLFDLIDADFPGMNARIISTKKVTVID